jgi:hypothetical protein
VFERLVAAPNAILGTVRPAMLTLSAISTPEADPEPYWIFQGVLEAEAYANHSSHISYEFDTLDFGNRLTGPIDPMTQYPSQQGIAFGCFQVQLMRNKLLSASPEN